MNVTCGASRRIVAITELNIDGVDTRKIDDDEILLNRTRAGTKWVTVTELDN